MTIENMNLRGFSLRDVAWTDDTREIGWFQSQHPQGGAIIMLGKENKIVHAQYFRTQQEAQTVWDDVLHRWAICPFCGRQCDSDYRVCETCHEVI